VFHPEPGVAEQVASVFMNAGVSAQALGVIDPGTSASLGDLLSIPALEGVCVAAPASLAIEINRQFAEADAAIRPVIVFREDPADEVGAGQPLAGSPHYLHRFVHERSLSIDTTASGGNASLLSIGDGSSSLPGDV